MINDQVGDLGPDFDIDMLGIKDFEIDPPEIKNSSGEVNLNDFDNFQHECPKCGFEWNDKD